jgi:hypothetical protein
MSIPMQNDVDGILSTSTSAIIINFFLNLKEVFLFIYYYDANERILSAGPWFGLTSTRPAAGCARRR